MEKNQKLNNNQTQFQPKQYKKKRYYTPNDVKIHNTANDCWNTMFHEVYDITKLIQDNIQSELSRPLIQVAGTDISHWFDPKTRNPRTKADINTGVETYYCPQGKFLHISQGGPLTLQSDAENKNAWWKVDTYKIGRLTFKTRKIKIINMLTDHEDIIEVPSEETINEILERYKDLNEHAASYTWKRLGRPIDMEKTLEENNILDETEEFERLDIAEEEWYIPALHLYFNDDLTVA